MSDYPTPLGDEDMRVVFYAVGERERARKVLALVLETARECLTDREIQHEVDAALGKDD